MDQEFDAITSAFAGVGGHKHDGSVGEGAPITVVGPVQDLVVTSSSVSPKTDNTLDLGAIGKEFKDLFITGVANIDSLVADTADINAGTVDATTIGATTPSTGAFTTLSTSGAATLASATVGGVAVTTATNTQTLTGKTIDLTNNTLIASSAELRAAVTDETGTGALVFASSPTFTGVPLAPTPATNTNTTQIATTAYVVAQIADDAPTKTGVNASGSWNINAATATALDTPRTINGTLFSGTADITTANWGTSRVFTLGSTGKAVNGSAALTWTLTEIGAQAVNTKLTGLTGMGATAGIVVQTALDTFDTRTITASTGVSIANGSGAAGNPAISGVTQAQGVWNAGTDTTESVITPAKLAAAIVAQTASPLPPTVFLGSLTTTSGTTQTLSSLVLTDYSFLRITVSNVSSTGNGALQIDSQQIADAQTGANFCYGTILVDLANGVATGMLGLAGAGAGSTYGAPTGYSTATTSVVFSWSAAGSFDSGTIRVYGVR